MRRIVPPLIVGAVLARGCLLAPAWLVVLLLWTPGGAVAVVVVLYPNALVVMFHWRLRHPTPLPKVAPMPLPKVAPTPCPLCAGTEHDYRSQGLWDGMPDPVTGHSTGGSFGYGICKGCGSRWAQWDDAPPYVPSEEEWERQVARPEAARAERLRLWTEHHARRAEPRQPAS